MVPGASYEDLGGSLVVRHGKAPCGAGRESDGLVELQVTDAGPGTAERLLPQAFERFSRRDAARRRGGAGLGLSIVRAIARPPGGGAYLERPEGAGFDAWLSIPTREPAFVARPPGRDCVIPNEASAARVLGGLRAHASDLGLLLLGVLLPLILLAELAEDVWRREGFGWDLDVLNFMHDRRGPVLDVLMVSLSVVGGGAGLTVIVAALVVVLVRRGRRADAIFLVIAVGGAAVIELVAKLTFARPRPDLWTHLYPAAGYSFPSGHAMSSTALAVAVAALARDSRRRRWAIGLGALFAIGVGVSRVYLGVHYPSDVLAGWCAGLAWVSGLVLMRTMRRTTTGLTG